MDGEICDILACMNDSLTLGRLIRESRLERGLSLGQLASKVGRSSSSVRRWERDEVPPAIAILPDLAAALELDEEELQRLRPGSTVTAPDSSPSLEEPITGSTIEGETVSSGSVVAKPHPVEVHPGGASASRGGLFSDVSQAFFGSKPSWIGWARGLMTAVVLIILVVVLLWALGELIDALREVLDSFDVGTAG